MNSDDQLLQWLRAADADDLVPAEHLVDANGLLERARCRRRTSVVRAAAILFVAGTAAFAITRPEAPDQVASAPPRLVMHVEPIDANALRFELAELQQRAAVHRRVIDGLAQTTELAALEQQVELARGDLVAPELWRQETMRSAAISLQHAMMIERDVNDRARARLEYQRVAERFPGTTFAAAASTSAARLSANANERSL